MKTDLCGFCEHQRGSHHEGCSLCHAEPNRHGHYCEGALCCCTDFVEPSLSDEEIEAMMGESA